MFDRLVAAAVLFIAFVFTVLVFALLVALTRWNPWLGIPTDCAACVMCLALLWWSSEVSA
jgi:hypothetical protein